jgi:RNAse (barnase) inhibitor barstar
MRRINIDVSECQTTDAIFEALLSELGAPEWHGYNLDALWDSITCDDINATKPPYHVAMRGTKDVPTELARLLSQIQRLFDEAKKERGIDVCFTRD